MREFRRDIGYVAIEATDGWGIYDSSVLVQRARKRNDKRGGIFNQMLRRSRIQLELL